jgi:hypothetical protein
VFGRGQGELRKPGEEQRPGFAEVTFGGRLEQTAEEDGAAGIDLE